MQQKYWNPIYILHINMNLWLHLQHRLWWKLTAVPKGIHIYFIDVTVICIYLSCIHVTTLLLCFTFCHPTVYGYIALSIVFLRLYHSVTSRTSVVCSKDTLCSILECSKSQLCHSYKMGLCHRL